MSRRNPYYHQLCSCYAPVPAIRPDERPARCLVCGGILPARAEHDPALDRRDAMESYRRDRWLHTLLILITVACLIWIVVK